MLWKYFIIVRIKNGLLIFSGLQLVCLLCTYWTTRWIVSRNWLNICVGCWYTLCYLQLTIVENEITSAKKSRLSSSTIQSTMRFQLPCNDKPPVAETEPATHQGVCWPLETLLHRFELLWGNGPLDGWPRVYFKVRSVFRLLYYTCLARRSSSNWLRVGEAWIARSSFMVKQ